LVLFLFDCIIKKEYLFSQNIQRLKIPADATRRVSVNPRPEEPSFSEYWRRKQCEVRAMTFHFGCPDVMLTFTFNNQWDPVVKAKFQHCRELSLNSSELDMRFQPFESKQIWHKKNSENIFTWMAGFVNGVESWKSGSLLRKTRVSSSRCTTYTSFIVA
jgi:hypothetical protein